MMTYISRVAFIVTLTSVLATGLSAQPAEPFADRICASTLVSELPAAVFEVEPEGFDLRVAIAWAEGGDPPAGATLELQDQFKNIVASKAIIPKAGSITEEVLPDALASFSAHGPAYTLVMSGDLMQPFPFRAELTGLPGGGCGFNFFQNFLSQPALLDPELGAALRSLAGRGSPNLLFDALIQYPHLECQIASFAQELDALDDRAGIGTGSCSCPWTSWVEQTPERRESYRPLGRPLEFAGFEGPGEALQLGAQTLGEPFEMTVEGQTSVDVELRCWRFAAWQTLSVDVLGRPETIRAPVLRYCGQRCGGEVWHDTLFEAELEALATSATADGAMGAATEWVKYTVDGYDVFETQAEATAKAFPSAGQTASACISKADVWTRPQPSRAVLETSGTVNVEAALDGQVPPAGPLGTESHGFAELRDNFALTATGHAWCAVEPAAKVQVYETDLFTSPAGPAGIQVEPW